MKIMNETAGTRPWIRWVILLAWMSLLFWFSATPDLRTVPLVERLGLLPAGLGESDAALLELLLRKAAHIAAYALLAILAQWALAASFARTSQGHIVVTAFLFAVLYAITDEWHQHFVPTRFGSAMDVAIDAFGAGIGLLVRWGLATKRTRL